jgi:DNA-binding transcriptional regulator YdaS (Cro superfamily)
MEKTTPPAQLRRERAALRRAIACKGSMAALAAAIDKDLTYQAVQTWLKKGVPYNRCRAIERVTHGMVQCEELREGYQELYDRPYRRIAA